MLESLSESVKNHLNRNQNTAVRPVSVEEANILSSSMGRKVVKTLDVEEDDVYSIDDIAERIDSAQNNEADVFSEGELNDRLEDLDGLGVVNYDENEGMVEVLPSISRFDSYLDEGGYSKDTVLPNKTDYPAPSITMDEGFDILASHECRKVIQALDRIETERPISGAIRVSDIAEEITDDPVVEESEDYKHFMDTVVPKLHANAVVWDDGYGWLEEEPNAQVLAEYIPDDQYELDSVEGYEVRL